MKNVIIIKYKIYEVFFLVFLVIFKLCFMMFLLKYLGVVIRWEFYEMIKCVMFIEWLIIFLEKNIYNFDKFFLLKYCLKLELILEVVFVLLLVVYGYCSGGKYILFVIVLFLIYCVYKLYKFYRFFVFLCLL